MGYYYNNKILLGIICSLILSVSNAQKLKPSHSESIETSITSGKLENGLSYYLKPLENGSSKIHLRLVVKAGYRQEINGEYEFAHLVEHLGFVAGKNISSKKSGKILDEAGIRLAQLNGSTKNDDTAYFIDASSKNSTAIKVALSFFQDIIWNMEINEKNIALERLTILDEAKGGDYDLNQLNVYIENEVTGWGPQVPRDIATHIKTFKPQKIINFREKWYHPELMALIVIGDIPDVEELEDKIRDKFSRKSISDIPGSLENNKQTYLQKAPQFIRKTIEKAANTQQSNTVRASLYFRQQNKNDLTFQQKIKGEVIRNLFVKLLNERFQEKLSDYNIYHTVRSNFLEPPLALKIDIVAEKGLKKEILQQPITELNSIVEYGFTPEEFENAKSDLLLALAKTDTVKVSYWKDEIIQHFVYGKELPTNKISLQIELLKELSKEEFHSNIRNMINGQPEDISIAAYSGDPVLKHTENTIRRWFSEADELPVKTYATKEKENILIDSVEIAGLRKSAFNELDIGIPGATKYQLENGMSLILKPLDESEVSENVSDNIRFHGYIPKGINCYPKKDFFSAIYSTAILKNAGIGSLNKFELKDYLEKNKFKGYVNPYVETNQSGIKASVSIENLEIALQLVYFYLNQPRFNKIAFEDWKTETKFYGAYKNLTYENFQSAIRRELPYIEFTPQGSELVKGIDQTDLKRAQEIYREIFQDINDFTFLVTGDFKEDEVLNLFRKYLGTLPQKNGNHKKSYSTLKKVTTLKEAKSKIFYSKIPLKMPMTRIIYTKKTDSSEVNWKGKIKMELLRSSLSELLNRRLRFESEKGGTYHIGVGMNFSGTKNYQETFIHFNAYPKDIDRLIEEAKNVVNELKFNSVDDSLLKKLKDAHLQKKESYGNTLNQMYEYENFDKQWLELNEKQEFIQSIKPKDIQETASKYLEKDPLIFKMVSSTEI